MSTAADHVCDSGDFDRTLCPEPCGTMHSYCDTCGKLQDKCEWDTPPKTPPWPPERYPTTEEWVAWFLDNDHVGRLKIAAKAIKAHNDINRCLSAPGGMCWIDR